MSITMRKVSLTMAPSAGDALTITCFTCGMPSSREWAQKVHSRPVQGNKPFYPFLLQMTPSTGSVLKGDGTTFLCAFCHASLEAQWEVYESQQVSNIPAPNRKYSISKFLCAVCAVETYRKRVRALPFQEFPFLVKQRQPGSLTLGDNPLAVVCLDCSETLWAQSAEYDRWGLPVHKRHFNWMARPPPPEDSVEATVARLPSGETQLPRCPPIEPQVRPKCRESSQDMSHRLSNSNLRSEDGMSVSHSVFETEPVRKSSVGEIPTSSMDAVSTHSQPPIVTVAPMSSHTSLLNSRKETLSIPSTYASKYDGTVTAPPPIGPPQTLYSRSSLYPPVTFGPFGWGNREAGLGVEYPYAPTMDTLQQPPGTSWSWLPQPSNDLLRYQAFMRGFPNTGLLNLGDPYYSTGPPSGLFSASVPVSGASAIPPSSSPYISPYALGSTLRSSPPQQHIHSHVPHASMTGHKDGEVLITSSSKPRNSSSCSSDTNKSGKSNSSTEGDHGEYTRKKFVHSSKEKSTKSGSASLKRLSPKVSKGHYNSTGDCSKSSDISDSDEGRNSSRPKSHSKSFVGSPSSRQEVSVPKKWNWHSHAAKKQEQDVNRRHEHRLKEDVDEVNSENQRNEYIKKTPCVDQVSKSHESAMDLSFPNEKPPSSTPSAASSKFMIEYLCQSENPKSDIVPKRRKMMCSIDELENNTEPSDLRPRNSVIVVPKPESSEINEPQPHNKQNALQTNCISSQMTLPEDTNGTENHSPIQERVVTDTDETPSSNKEHTPEQQTSKVDADAIVEKTLAEFLVKVRADEKLRQEKEMEQLHFLKKLGLITPQKKMELELDILISRAEKQTLPLIQMRPDSPPKVIVRELFQKQLRQVVFDDPSLKATFPESQEVSFLSNLGLRPATKAEKQRREHEWRLILTERVLRGRRDKRLRASKRIWDEEECAEAVQGIINKMIKKEVNVLGSLTLTMPIDTPPQELNSSDLLTTCTSVDQSTSEDSVRKRKGMSIVYPKYIPSYAVDEETKVLETPVLPEKEKEKTRQGSDMTSRILRVPVFTKSTTLHTVTVDKSDAVSNNKTKEDNPVSNNVSERNGMVAWDVDVAVTAHLKQWRKFKKDVNEVFIPQLVKASGNAPFCQDAGGHLKKLRLHLQTLYSEALETERMIKVAEHVVLPLSTQSNAMDTSD